MAKKGSGEENSEAEISDSLKEQQIAVAEELAPGAKAMAFPVVAVGASAGGLEAFRELLKALPDQPDCAFVFIQHLSPKHESLMADILDKMTALTVVEAQDNTELEKNHIYVIPPDRYIRIENGVMVLDKPVEQHGLRLPIDYFFRSLAEQQGERAIAVVLTGTGSDGSEGVRDVKGAGGLVIVQDPQESRYDGMPRSAIKTKMVDFVEPIGKIPERITAFIRHPYIDRRQQKNDSPPAEPFEIRDIIALLRTRTEFDFTPYKRGTLQRRIQRRMGLHQLKAVDDYLTKLRDDPSEIASLCKDLLITVTRFFRDDSVWSTLKGEIAELAARAAQEEREFRIWCPGCATGEEAYSLAILVQEASETISRPVQYQIFATDLDEDAINLARDGRYPKNIEQDVSELYLKRYFDDSENGYRITKRIREHVVFAAQNVVSDPPFSNLDMISCRNLLIYIGTEMQSRILDMFHFALRPDGLLLLGNSETLGRNSHLFTAISQEDRIYRRVPLTRPERSLLPFSSPDADASGEIGSKTSVFRSRENITETARRILISRYAPATVLVNGAGESRYFHGPVQQFLEIPQGEPTVNVLDMANAGMKLRLKNALQKAKQTGQGVSAEALRITHSSGTLDIRIEVEPVHDAVTSEALYLISFVEILPSETKERQSNSTTNVDEQPVQSEDSSELLRQLEYELQATREDLQTTIEELETTNEELKASNEEAMSTNEELQSTNEELETSREELQSLNEELVTVNSQLEDKVGELEKANDDISNLLTSVEIAVVFLGRDLRIRRFTEPAKEIFSIIETDIGRPVSDITIKIDDERFIEDAKSVLKSLSPSTKQVASKNNSQWFSRRIRPYRTTDDRIEGVVISYTDITSLRESVERLEKSEKQQRIVAYLGGLAVSLESSQEFFDVICETLASEGGFDYSKILQYDSENSNFRMISGVGWDDDIVGTKRVPGDKDSQAGYTAMLRAPVMVEDFAKEKRFSQSELSSAHGVQSGISCTIGRSGLVWGVIGIHCKEPQSFKDEDADFVQAIANLAYDNILRIERETDLSEAEEVLQLSLDAAEMGAWRWDIESDVMTWDETTRNLFGRDEEDDETLTSEVFYSTVHPDDLEQVRNAVDNSVDNNVPYQVEFRTVRPNGEIISLVARGDVITIKEKRWLIGVIYDITRQKTLERQYELIARELDHRVKNLLATVVSMSRMMGSQSNSIEEFKELFQARMQSLANTHGLLSKAKWQGATLRDLIEAETSPFEDQDDNNIECTGPHIVLEPHAAQCLSMAFHELTTNAAKYGALSTQKGRLSIDWEVKEEENLPQLQVSWIETGGPKPKEPRETGFGSQVVNELLVNQLNAEVETEFAGEGFRCSIQIPAKENVARSSYEKPDLAEDVGVGVKRTTPVANVLEGLTILVVDDEWFVSAAVAEALTQAGATVPEPAASLEQAESLIAQESADFAVLDYNIAGRPITPIARQLRQQGVPCLVVSGYGSGLKLPKDLSDVKIVAKPVREDRLISIIEEILAEQGNSDKE